MEHLPVNRFIPPEQFGAWEKEGLDMGISAVVAGPFVRSSYHAKDALKPSGGFYTEKAQHAIET